LLPKSATQGIGYKEKKHFLDSGFKIKEYFLNRFPVDQETLKLVEMSLGLRYLELYRRYGQKEEFKTYYDEFRKNYHLIDAELIKFSSRGKLSYYISRILSRVLVRIKFDFYSRVHKELSKKHHYTS
jgi:hypothetical protein